MRLFVESTEHNFATRNDDQVYIHNPKVDYVCFCECGGSGTRSQYGRDDFCPRCKKPLDWSKESKW